MSYDVSLDIDTGGVGPFAVFSWNYTYNVYQHLRAAFADDRGIRMLDGLRASEAMPLCAKAVSELVAHPEWSEWDPRNGWGSRVSLIEALTSLVDAMTAHPLTTVRVS